MRTRLPVVFIVVMAVAGTGLLPSWAYAYIGPGAGLSAFGSLLSLIAAILVGIFGFIWFPIKRALRMLRARRKPGDQPNATVEAPRP